MADDTQVTKTTEKRKYTGKIKWLDAHGIGYILPDNHFFPEVYISPSSISSDIIIQEGDCVEFRTNLRGSNPSHSFEAIDVVPIGPKCSCCNKFGHYTWKCKEITNYKCYRCGLMGHYARDCDQYCCGWRVNERGSSTRVRVRFRVRVASKSIVCVKKKEDVKKVEEVEDCFILEFDPTVDDDDDDDDDDDEEEEEEEEEEEDGGDDDDEMRGIVCVKKGEDVKKVEEDEDCFLLDFDPSELDGFSKLSLGEKSDVVPDDEDGDVLILAQKGQVACRDYPHSRHLCATHPFKKTPHEVHCKLCYCFICDIPVPCHKWNEGSFRHCDATDETEFWKTYRSLEKRRTQE